ncbi:MAG: hypothetical protein DRJ67_05730 [Thermoprotei archaeon]|nr:MAG: hypothetical protein DRJ67_05730 [Thermoprotei archaeon]
MLASYVVEASYRARYTPPKGFPGTAIRGAFGVALRKVACATGAPSCRECALYRSCTYSRMFESSSLLSPSARLAARSGVSGVTNPYTIEVLDAPRGRLRFRLNLFGEALEWEPEVLVALLGMGEEGLGIDPRRLERRKFAVERITRSVELGEEVVVYSRDSGISAPRAEARHRSLLEVFEEGARRMVEEEPRELLLRFRTPFRLVEGGRPRPSPSFTGILMNLARRYSLLAEYHGAGRPIPLSVARALKRESRMVRLRGGEVRRVVNVYKFEVGGGRRDFGRFYLSTLTYEVPPQFWRGQVALLAASLLLLGEYLHVGKLATAGYGDYELYYRS